MLKQLEEKELAEWEDSDEGRESKEKSMQWQQWSGASRQTVVDIPDLDRAFRSELKAEEQRRSAAPSDAEEGSSFDERWDILEKGFSFESSNKEIIKFQIRGRTIVHFRDEEEMPPSRQILWKTEGAQAKSAGYSGEYGETNGRSGALNGNWGREASGAEHFSNHDTSRAVERNRNNDTSNPAGYGNPFAVS